MVLKLKVVTAGAHVHVAQFLGADVDHLARIGSVSMRDSEWPAYHGLMTAGTATERARSGLHVIIEEQ